MKSLTGERKHLEVSAALLLLALLAVRQPGTLALPVTTAVGVISLSLLRTSFPARDTRSKMVWLVAVLLGIGAFTATVGLSHRVSNLMTGALVANSVAALCEEIFFRGFLYDRLSTRGPLMAIVASALLFALIHVPTYGWPIVPIDFAAGLLLGWQRWVTGTWTSSAVTHLFANVLSLL